MNFEGISASPGIAIGRAFLYDNELNYEIEKREITDFDHEVERLKSSIAEAKEEILSIREKTLEKLGEEKAQIFDAHILLLEDPEILSQVRTMMGTDRVSPEWALNKVTQNFIDIFEAMDDEYMRERASDIRDVFSRVKRHLLGLKNMDLSLLKDEVILIAHDLAPSETATMNKDSVLGFITNIGGKTSHSAIMARTMEIPAVVGVSNITNIVKDDDLVVFDGSEGKIYINPSKDLLKSFEVKKEEFQKQKSELSSFVGVKSQTRDGRLVEVAGNIGQLQDLDSFEKNDAEAVGLYRTEFLFMDRDRMPSEEEQFQVYSKIVKRLNGKECIFRTLDIGGDKKLPYLNVAEEENPFLGYRAIRICLNDIDLFKTQLRAILRTSTMGKIGIMFPMISNLEELLKAKSILEETKSELLSDGHQLSNDIKVGMMIEVPSSALISDILAKHVDFFSIGTNDLTQYTCAVDRMNEKISHLYDPFNPGLLRLIQMVAKASKDHGVKLAMCGSMAHDPLLVPVFLGMGFDELSMSPMHVLPTRKLISELDTSNCRELVSEIMNIGESNKIKETLNKFLNT